MAKAGDSDLWQAALRDVKPLRKRKPAAPIVKTPPRASQPVEAPTVPSARPDARIDLHGMTQDDAHGTLRDFITASARAGRRCVLVITGKGLRRLGDDSSADAGIGVLRNAVPRWLNEAPNRARILAFAAAQPCDGGGGALYVLLRRQPRPAGR